MFMKKLLCNPMLIIHVFRLKKDPATRATLNQIREDVWTTNHHKEPLLPSKEDNTRNTVDPLKLTEEDFKQAFKNRSTVFQVIKAVGRFKRSLSHKSLTSMETE